MICALSVVAVFMSAQSMQLCLYEKCSLQGGASVGKAKTFDIVVIGAGMGGMLTACQLAQAGKRVLLVEKLSFLGGRFSGFNVNGSEIPTGAFHTFPHGERGPFSQALRRSGVDITIKDAKVFASFHVDGKHIIAQNTLDILKILLYNPSRTHQYRQSLHDAAHRGGTWKRNSTALNRDWKPIFPA